MGDEIAVEVVTRKKPRIEGRHAYEACRARQFADHRVAIKLAEPDHAGACEQRTVTGHEEPMRMEDRQRVEKHILFREAPTISQRKYVGSESTVTQHSAL